jgi:integrase
MRSCRKERIVRHKLADGRVKEYRYPPKPASFHFADDSVAALIQSYRLSPEWGALSPKTQANKGYYLRHLERLGDKRLAELSRGDVLELRDAVAHARGHGAANLFLAVTSALLGWALERGRIPFNPVAKARRLEGGHLPAWTSAQADYALTRLPEHLRRVVIMGRYTGQRRGDLCAMMWSAYDGNSLKVTQQKTGVSLVIPVLPALRAALDAWKREAVSLFILNNEHGKPWQPDHLTHAVEDAMRGLGLAGLNVHGLRKLCAAELSNAGCSVHEIASITGHRSLAMVQLYTQSADQQRLATSAMAKLVRSS